MTSTFTRAVSCANTNAKRPGIFLGTFFLLVLGLLPVALSMGAANTLGQENGSVSPAAGKWVDFQKDIAPLLKNRCASCHKGDEAKGGFVIGDRDAVLGYIEAGNAANSSLWTDYLTQPSKSKDKDSLVMPPDGPLAATELALIKFWIDEGANWPAGASITGQAEPTKETSEVPKAGLLLKLYRATAPFHPAVVHFPIALFVVSGGCAFLSYFLGSRCQSMAFHCLWIAALSSIASVVMGWAYADLRGYPSWDQAVSVNAPHEQMTFFWHRWLGTGLTVASWIVVILGLLAGRSKAMTLHHVWRMGAIVMALLVSLVGHQGGELVHGEIVDKAIELFSK